MIEKAVEWTAFAEYINAGSAIQQASVPSTAYIAVHQYTPITMRVLVSNSKIKNTTMQVLFTSDSATLWIFMSSNMELLMEDLSE